MRITGASVALLAAGGWMLDRLDLLANPFAPAEQTLIERPMVVVIAPTRWSPWPCGRSTVARSSPTPPTAASKRGAKPQRSAGRDPGRSGLRPLRLGLRIMYGSCVFCRGDAETYGGLSRSATDLTRLRSTSSPPSPSLACLWLARVWLCRHLG